MDAYAQLTEITKALAHPVRLQILDMLRGGEACVCHLEAVLGQRQAYISQQLARLREAGLVVDRRDGLNVFYALADESVAGLLDALHAAAVSVSGEALRLPRVAASASCTCPKCVETKVIQIV